MTELVFALRGAAAIAVLTTVVGGVPRVVQLGLAIVVGVWAMIAANVGAPIVAGPELWIVAARELVIGATIGIVAAVPLVAAAIAGRLVDIANRGGKDGPYARLFGILAAAVFVGIDGHVTFVRGIAESYANVPAIADVQPRVIDALGTLIAIGVRLAVPWLVTAAVVEIARGVGMRLGNRAAVHAPGAAAVPAAIAMMTAALVGTLAVAIATAIRTV